jgi:hypothetical protein
MPSAPPVIARRFNGPPDSGNGGYSCGVLGALIGDAAEVTLRHPPPLDTSMTLSDQEGGLRLLHGETLIAEGRAAEPTLAVPESPGLDAAIDAESRYVGFEAHAFPGCFVCGPERRQGDGLRIFTGVVPDRALVAARWIPDASMGTADGRVDPRIVWSALDCPSYFGGRLRDYGALALLGRLTAKLQQPIRVGSPYVVIGWPLEHLGRKWEGGSAIFTPDGELCAFARALWVELRPR